MEIILNKKICLSITGHIRSCCPWFIRGRNGRFYAVYRGEKNEDIKQAWFRVFVQDLRTLQNAKYISSLILTDQERRWLS